MVCRSGRHLLVSFYLAFCFQRFVQLKFSTRLSDSMISSQQLLPTAGRMYRAMRPGQHHVPAARQLSLPPALPRPGCWDWGILLLCFSCLISRHIISHNTPVKGERTLLLPPVMVLCGSPEQHPGSCEATVSWRSWGGKMGLSCGSSCWGFLHSFSAPGQAGPPFTRTE